MPTTSSWYDCCCYCFIEFELECGSVYFAHRYANTVTHIHTHTNTWFYGFYLSSPFCRLRLPWHAVFWYAQRSLSLTLLYVYTCNDNNTFTHTPSQTHTPTHTHRNQLTLHTHTHSIKRMPRVFQHVMRRKILPLDHLYTPLLPRLPLLLPLLLI